MSGLVDLYSDTQTRPTAAMRAAMAGAEVGDEQRREDPTVLELERRVAELLGHEAAVFLPSGTMCNEIAIRLHIRPGGDELLIGRETHPLVAEAGGPAALSGAVITVLDGDAGRFDAATLEAAIEAHPAADRYSPNPRLVCVEQPTNLWGGRVWPLAQIEAVLGVARAPRAEDAPRRRAAAERDDRERRRAGRRRARIRQRLAGLHQGPGRAGRRGARRVAGADRRRLALEADARRRDAPGRDRRRRRPVRARPPRRAARRRPRAGAAAGRGARGAAGRDARPATVETNIVVFGLEDARGFAARLEAEHGVRMGALKAGLVRAVTHLDVDDDGIDRALAAARAVLAG